MDICEKYYPAVFAAGETSLGVECVDFWMDLMPLPEVEPQSSSPGVKFSCKCCEHT
jgi:hypothetical protein